MAKLPKDGVSRLLCKETELPFCVHTRYTYTNIHTGMYIDIHRTIYVYIHTHTYLLIIRMSTLPRAPQFLQGTLAGKKEKDGM